MELGVRTLCVGVNPEIMIQKQRMDSSPRLPFSLRIWSSVSMKMISRENFRRDKHKMPHVIRAISSDLVSLDHTMTPFEDFTVTTDNLDDRELKIRVDVSSTKTQAIFDDVFSKLVAAAQPIPGFRRAKGGKTPDIPKDALLHIIGPSTVKNQSIKKIINTTVATYVEKESLKVTKDLIVKQSYEELESKFEPGNEFSFEATLQLQETRTA